MLALLLILLALFALGNLGMMVRAAIRQRAWPRFEAAVVGAVVNFLDTLGIGSLAPTMAWLKMRRVVPDALVPPTMIAGLTLPVLAQGLIFLSLLGVALDPLLLFGCIAAVLAGALVGLQLINRAQVWAVQMAAAAALLVAAAFYILSMLDLMPVGGTASQLSPGLTLVAIAANFIFGILLNFGVGNYAPTLALLSLMGLDPRLCFPIMAAGGALAAATISAGHLRDDRIDMRVAGAMVLTGVPAVLVAALLVKSLPLTLLKGLVTLVIIYTAIVMLRSAWATRRGRLKMHAAPPV